MDDPQQPTHYLVIPGVLTVAPQYLRPQARGGRTRQLRAADARRPESSDGRRRRHRRRPTAAGEKADCTISADPAAFLLLGYGRVSQFAPVLRGQLRHRRAQAGLATKFGKLIASP